ncbi:DEAD/DEAH box helicase family protein [Streptomyces luteireticuli]|uniref:Helicase/UvrB N-terminal domain-containing protein n=1 Tax=Streptomyces luteireticuli TaxID=173858 RepID=A0ABP3J319_9ACTN
MELRAHQIEALAAIEAAAVAGEQRMTVVAACGSGKTLIAQQAAQRLAGQGAVLVLMPTRALVTQTVRRWREAGRTGPALAVCSLSQSGSGLSTSADSCSGVVLISHRAVCLDVAGSAGWLALLSVLGERGLDRR